MIQLTVLDSENVLRATAGHKYLVEDLTTGKQRVLRCYDSPLGCGGIFFTCDTSPERNWEEGDGAYAETFKHLRPVLAEGSAAINTRATFSDMLARKAYRIE